MTLDSLVSSGRAELVRGAVRVRDGDTYIVVAKQNGDTLAITEEGRRFMAQASTTLDSTVKPIRQRKAVED